jgi:DNA-binding MarR family transcriptional regulator
LTRIEGGNQWLESLPKLSIANALLEDRKPQTTGEIARKARRDPSNVSRVAAQMANDGILVPHIPPKTKRRSGRKPRVAYTLAADAKIALESHLENSGALRTPPTTQQQVTVSVDDPQHFLDVMRLIASRGINMGISWAAKSEGSPKQHVYTFEGRNALERAEDLMAAFAGLELECSRSMLTGITDGRQTIKDARRIIETAREARKERDQET